MGIADELQWCSFRKPSTRSDRPRNPVTGPRSPDPRSSRERYEKKPIGSDMGTERVKVFVAVRVGTLGRVEFVNRKRIERHCGVDLARLVEETALTKLSVQFSTW